MAVPESETPEVLMARFEELSVLETEFEDVELEISTWKDIARCAPSLQQC
tara:strand:+ start:36008 stop:36157 length:150 start_codon:yes stop_codon:yes gene_type:complete